MSSSRQIYSGATPATFVSSADIAGNLNVIADWLSPHSQVIGSEWSLHPQLAQAIWEKWGRHHIDLFTMRDNNKCPVFMSPYPDEEAWVTDTLLMKWNNMWTYRIAAH